MLTIKGYRIVGVAKNGGEAVEVYKILPERPDVIIMDHRMPVKNRIEATKEILPFDPDGKVIFTSADMSVQDLALSVGAVRFEIKPFQMDVLLHDIEPLACA